MGQGSTDASNGSDKSPRVRAKHRKPIIGLTGGIGAGKSTVARILESLGAAVIDFDRLAHEQLRDRSVIETLCDWWGEGILGSDGSVDRQSVAAIVFENPKQLARLEDLLYPRIGRARKDLVASYDCDPSVRAVVLEVPKLFEVGLAETCDAVIFVEADDEVRVERVTSSRGGPESALRR
ncbi:MAG: dephospho-CoA kinase, partial [Planctomycetes bacterium]|nr:dephospho-CoA kinase [Planctomycetota bacterium]